MVEQLVPGPCGDPPLAKQLLGGISVQVPSGKQQASGGWEQKVVEQLVPGPCGEPPLEKQTLGSWSMQLPSG